MDRHGEALVLRCVDFGESDRIVHLLTPDSGRLDAIAKGARRSVRRFAGTLDLFHHLRIALAPRRRTGVTRLEQASLLRAHSGIRAHPARFALGCFLIELLDRLAPAGAVGAEPRRLFAFARGALAALETETPDARLRTLLELRTLDALGLRPELSRCVRCGSPPGDASRAPRAFFHVAEGGPVCAACGGAHVPGLLPVHLGTLRALEQGLRFDSARLRRLALSPVALAEARGLLARFQRFHLGLELRSERFLDEMLAAPAAAAAPPAGATAARSA